jgi:hypothetical protein
MRRPTSLPLFIALASIFATGAALAEEWHVCIATAGNAQGGDKHVHWAVTQPFEVSSIPDWQSQFEQAKPERYAFASSRGWSTNEEGFSCSEGMPDLATAQTRHGDMLANFESRRELGANLGVPFSWENWSWRPTGGGASSAQAEVAANSDAGEATTDDAGQPDAEAAATAAAEARRRDKEIADAQAERDRLATEKAKLEKEIADARAERDRLAAEKAKREREARASTDTDANRCVTSPELRQNDTFQGNTAAYVTNGCGTQVDVRICLMKEGKGWNCGMTYGLAPQKSWSWSSMQATGQVFMDARVSGSSRQMASPQ